MPSKRSVKTESHHHHHEVELISAVTDAEYYERRQEKNSPNDAFQWTGDERGNEERSWKKHELKRIKVVKKLLGRKF